MDGILSLLFLIGLVYLIILAIMAIIRRATNLPTWSGIIISAILGMLPFYLFLCFFGILGVARNRPSDDMQSTTGCYAEEMSRRYAYYDSPKRMKRGWFKYVVLVFVVMYLIYHISHESDEQELVTPTEIVASDSIVVEENKEETPPVIKKKTSAKRQVTKSKISNPEMGKPLVREQENLAKDRSALPETDILQEDNSKEKSTIELLEERNHARVVEQAKEAGVSTEGSTLDILERINRKYLEEHLK